jgi:hypothetical protein
LLKKDTDKSETSIIGVCDIFKSKYTEEI